MPFGVVSGVGLGRGVLDFGGDRQWGRGSLGEYNAEMAYWSIIDSCVKSWQYFPTQITSLNSLSNSLSYDVVRFEIELGVEEKFMCKNVTKQAQDGIMDFSRGIIKICPMPDRLIRFDLFV